MIVAFCGHSQIKKSVELQERILSLLQDEIGDKPAQMYLGGYGEFDAFAYECCKKYKDKHPRVTLVFVSPYLTVEYQKNRLQYEKSRYDEIIYFEIK